MARVKESDILAEVASVLGPLPKPPQKGEIMVREAKAYWGISRQSAADRLENGWNGMKWERRLWRGNVYLYRRVK